jgi:hypothetical protein
MQPRRHVSAARPVASAPRPYAVRMLPLQGVAVGLLLVVVDVNFGRDLLPDWAGWLIAFVALRRIERLDRSFATADVVAFVSLLVSAATWLWPLSSRNVVATLAAGAVQGLFIVLVCLGIRNRARQASDGATADFAQKAAAGAALVTAATVVGIAALAGRPDASGSSLNGPAALVAVAALAVALVVLVASMVLLFTRADRPYLAAPGPERART